MKVKVADILGNESTKHVGFSWLYIVFGPLYLLCRLKFASALLLSVVFYYLLPVPGMEFIAVQLCNLPRLSQNNMRAIEDTLMFFRQPWHLPYRYIGMILALIIHLGTAFVVEGPILKRHLQRKRLFPVSEEDARNLIRYRAASTDVKLAPKNGIQSLYGYKSAEQLWLEQNRGVDNEDRSEANPLLEALSPLPKNAKNRRRDHYNQLLNAKEITPEEYRTLVDKLGLAD